MTDENCSGPWICHICDYRSPGGESTACSICFKIACATHLQRVSRYNRDSGLFELRPVCVWCAATKLH